MFNVITQFKLIQEHLSVKYMIIVIILNFLKSYKIELRGRPTSSK